MKKFAGKNILAVAALLGTLLIGSQSVLASATSSTDLDLKVDGVIVITAHSQVAYVEAGRFIREYRKQLINELSDVEQNLTSAKDFSLMCDIKPEPLVIAFTSGLSK